MSDRPFDPTEPTDAPGPDQEPAQPQRPATRREFVGLALGLIALTLLALRLVWVQGLDLSGRAASAENDRLRQESLPALRGEILDRNGAILARSIQRYDIAVDQTLVRDLTVRNPDGSTETRTVLNIIRDLADILHISDEEVKDALDGEANFQYLYRSATPEQWNAVRDLQLGFVTAEPVSQRSYPNGQLGGSVVGFMGGDGDALAGVELSQDEILSGQDGIRTFEISADGVRIPVAPHDETSPVNGGQVTLTLDRDVQYYAQEAVAARVKELDAEWGTAVVLRVSDGQVLALADSTMVDPNDPGRTENEGDYSPRSVAAAVEPGSTEKTLTAAAAIEEGKIQPLSEVSVPPELTIDGQTFTDSFTHGAEDRTFAGIIADSMNTGTVEVGKELTPEQRHTWLKNFGIGELTGIEIPGETMGLLADWTAWDTRQQYTVLFGQGLSQSPLRTATIYQAVANDGVLVEPRVVLSTTDADGTTTIPEPPEPRRVVSSETAAQVLEIMETVITVGGAPDAAVPGYRAGGKSGTAEAPGDQGGYDGYTTSFVGMAPMEDPQYVVAVTLQRPQGEVRTIGASGVFSQIMGDVLKHYGVSPSTTEPVALDKFFGKDADRNEHSNR
ncbi:peptidoglycan D,D-transpeptidase FtsI family protein [Kocuria sp.]|uniref:peptidoglycan D,D-transpeptidase FtsI family protein n=1 Tax=Kocuria sp. TaxID=1871328 RepID=UPI0026E0A881|nr:penicillin-binding protein 2 [Kocuria sp.]MDO5618457.1 penicillin-binding protein 2 [Kocuria sp.]